MTDLKKLNGQQLGLQNIAKFETWVATQTDCQQQLKTDPLQQSKSDPLTL